MLNLQPVTGICWLSLDEGDNDPLRFWTYLVAACQSVRPGAGEAALALVRLPQPPPVEAVPTILINDLARLDGRLVLVLDGYHAIHNEAIHAALAYLLEHLPASLYPLISTRLDPPWLLARFRARNQLVEIRAQDRQLSLAEATEFFNRSMGLSLSAEDVAALEARTEGWAAGLQLALPSVPLDGERTWVRYHQLFAGLLRARLRRLLPLDQVAELHRRASAWYERVGMPAEAIAHALDAADYAAAVRLIESHTVEMLVRGYSQTVEGWLDAIPSGLHLQSPKIRMAFIWIHLLHGDYTQIPPYVERLQSAFSDSLGGGMDPSARAEWLTLQSFLLDAQGKAAESLALAQQALALAPPEDGYVLSMAYDALAAAYQLAGDYAHSI